MKKLILIILILLLLTSCQKPNIIEKDPQIQKISIFEEHDESGVLFPEDSAYTGDLFSEDTPRPSEMIDK